MFLQLLNCYVADNFFVVHVPLIYACIKLTSLYTNYQHILRYYFNAVIYIRLILTLGVFVLFQTQFCFLIVNSLFYLAPDCKVPNIYGWVFIPNVFIVFYMFYDFYRKSYTKESIYRRSNNKQIHNNNNNSNSKIKEKL